MYKQPENCLRRTHVFTRSGAPAALANAREVRRAIESLIIIGARSSIAIPARVAQPRHSEPLGARRRRARAREEEGARAEPPRLKLSCRVVINSWFIASFA